MSRSSTFEAAAPVPAPSSAAATRPPPPTRDANRVLALSTIAFTLLFAVWLMFGVLGVAIQDELHLSKIQFSWLTAAAVLSGSLWRLPLGMLADRVGGKSLMTALLVASAIPCFLVSRARTFGELIACALLFGVAGNSFSVGIAWNAAWTDRQRQGTALGIFGAGNVGASVTKLGAPALIVAVPGSVAGGLIPGGWRLVPVVYAALLLVMAAVLWVLSPSPDRRPGAGRSLAGMLAPLRAVRLWRFGLYYVVVFGAYVALSLWLPSYYRRVYHLPLGMASLLTALFIFPASLLRPLGGWLSDRWGARPVTYAVFVAMLLAAGLLSLPAASLGLDKGPLAFFCLVEVLGVGMGIGKASVYKYIPDYFPADVGAAGGLVGTLGALGGFLLPLGFGYLEQETGVAQSCFWLLSLLVLACLCWLSVAVWALKRRAAGASDGRLDAGGHAAALDSGPVMQPTP